MAENNLLRILQKNLRLLLARSGRSAREASLALGTNDSLVTAILRGRSKNPRIDTLTGLAAYFSAQLGVQITPDNITTRDLSTIKEILDATGLTHEVSVPHRWTNEIVKAQNARMPELADLPRDVPILGAGMAGSDGGEFYFNGETAGWARRPPALIGMKSAFAIRVTGDSMKPLFEPGKIAYVTPERPPVSGDYVLVELHPSEGETHGPAFIKQLVRRTGDGIVLRQLNPAKELPKIPTAKIKHIYRVPRHDELLTD